MYYPKSQIKTNLYTNGGEYILSTTKKIIKDITIKFLLEKYTQGKTQLINLISFIPTTIIRSYEIPLMF
jgi:hypothetical protein